MRQLLWSLIWPGRSIRCSLLLSGNVSANGTQLPDHMKCLFSALSCLRTSTALVTDSPTHSRWLKVPEKEHDPHHISVTLGMWFIFPQRVFKVLCWYFAHEKSLRCEDSFFEPLSTVTAILLGTMWSVLLFFLSWVK